ncbi:hypothetical protein [Paraburkholderia diazotrophica]|uniref:hypothetical protein n=1 Tax=Paraburkholderia diazotrophica TaxID=667676 RepID=UPI001FEB7611|nr:hypothetical protein [Paraburkholderia diazotrophica]
MPSLLGVSAEIGVPPVVAPALTGDAQLMLPTVLPLAVALAAEVPGCRETLFVDALVEPALVEDGFVEAASLPPPPPPQPARRIAIEEKTRRELTFMKCEWAIEIRPKTAGKNARIQTLDFEVGFLARRVVITSTTTGCGGVPVISSDAFPAYPPLLSARVRPCSTGCNQM